MIYIASPYSHPKVEVQIDRFREVKRYTVRLMAMGQVCFSPIAYGHQFHIIDGCPADHEFWREFNETILLSCSEVHGLMLPGWRESKGMTAEFDFAERHGIKVKMVQP